jgi:iron complex transport system ATP-binding protein
MTPFLELSRATLVRSGVRVLDNLSFSIRRGEHTAILGPNGAGKSSLIRILTLEDRPLASSNGAPPLRLFGRASWDLLDLRRRLGVVTGELDLGFGLGSSGGRVSGLDAAVSGLLGTHGVFPHHEVTDGMRQLGLASLFRVDALHLAGRTLPEMSAGERRRVLIARALITDPEALLLDEPTAGLDVVARLRFLETIRRLAASGTTVILVTHHVDEVIPETRRVVLLRDGRVAFDGPPRTALTGPRLTAVFGAPLTIERRGGYHHVRIDAGTGRHERPTSDASGTATTSSSGTIAGTPDAARRRDRGAPRTAGRSQRRRRQARAVGTSEASRRDPNVSRTKAAGARSSRRSPERSSRSATKKK